MKYIIPAAITLGVGIIVLLSLFFEDDNLTVARLALVNWVVIIAGLALLVGFLHLMLVHLRKVAAKTAGWPYGVLTVISALAVLVLGLLEGPQAVFEATSVTQLLFRGVLVASQASLAGLMVFFLLYAAVRLLRTRSQPSSVLFLVVVIVVLLGWVPLVQNTPLPGLRNWLFEVPVVAGARGILLGVALGTVMVGLRVLTGAERPYKD